MAASDQRHGSDMHYESTDSDARLGPIRATIQLCNFDQTSSRLPV